MLKKSLLPFLLVVLLGAPAWSEVLATLMVDPSTSTGEAAQPIQFVIHVSTSRDIGALQFTLEYNTNIATFQGVVIDPSMPFGFSITNVNTTLPFEPSSPGTNENVLVQISGNGINQSFTGEQDVAILTFLFQPNTCGTSPIVFDPVCQRTHLATINPSQAICDPLLLHGAISDCPTDTPIRRPGGKQQLFESVPNPFNPSTMIRFELENEAQAQLRVFDVSGRTVRVLVNGNVAAGPHDVRWNGRDDSGHILPSGVYYYELVTPFGRDTKRTLLLK
jgi:FlgD Ig-like domain